MLGKDKGKYCLILFLVLMLWPRDLRAIDDFDILGGQGLIEEKVVEEEKAPVKAKQEKLKEIAPGRELQALEEARGDLQRGDPRIKLYELLNWEYRYWQLAVKNVEFEYMIRAYQDRRYVEAMHKLGELNRRIRLLLVQPGR